MPATPAVTHGHCTAQAPCASATHCASHVTRQQNTSAPQTQLWQEARSQPPPPCPPQQLLIDEIVAVGVAVRVEVAVGLGVALSVGVPGGPFADAEHSPLQTMRQDAVATSSTRNDIDRAATPIISFPPFSLAVRDA